MESAQADLSPTQPTGRQPPADATESKPADTQQQRKALRNKWVYKLKTGDDGNSPRYKAPIVVKGFHQKKGVNIDEIFAPVVKMTSIWTVLSIVASMNLEIEQLDVKTTFLHGELE